MITLNDITKKSDGTTFDKWGINPLFRLLEKLNEEEKNLLKKRLEFLEERNSEEELMDILADGFVKEEVGDFDTRNSLYDELLKLRSLF